MVLFRNINECNDQVFNRTFVLPNLPDGNLSSTQYCAGSLIEGESTAPGDSGGPSIIREYVGGGARFTLFGIVTGSFTFSDNIYLFIGHDEVTSQQWEAKIYTIQAQYHF